MLNSKNLSLRSAPSEGGLPSLRPTNVRWFMLGLVVSIMLAESLQRASLGIAGKAIQDEFVFSTQQMGWILSAFGLGQTLFQVPWGHAGDRYGPRNVLTLAILCSAISTTAIGFIPHVSVQGFLGVALSLICLRVLGGMGMAAAPTNSNKVVALWMSRTERGIGSSAIPIGSGLGSALAPVLTALTMQRWGWRFSYFLYGAITVAVAIAWRLFSTNWPEEHPWVNSAEVNLLRGSKFAGVATSRRAEAQKKHLSWAEMLHSRSVWAISLSFSCQQYAIMVFHTWFFIYLVRVRGLTLTQGGYWGSLPFICMILLSPVGGWMSDHAVLKYGKALGRRSTVWLGMGSSAVMLWAGSNITNSLVAIPLLAGAAGLNLNPASRT